MVILLRRALEYICAFRLQMVHDGAGRSGHAAAAHSATCRTVRGGLLQLLLQAQLAACGEPGGL